MSVRVRLAPSPTGYLHVGTARVALYNYLFARQHKGKFLLRIEDTDRERSSPEMTEIIMESLKWLGMDYDEEPVMQSANLEKHKSYLPLLEKSDLVYKCFCTREELTTRREKGIKETKGWKYDRKCLKLSPEEIKDLTGKGTPYVLRARIPDGETVFTDLIHGKLTRQNSEIEDFILFRSDHTPVYNFAVTADDIDMGITHVIRGDDHISNTFKQDLIYQILGKPLPVFAHLPLILNAKKEKLSKRTGKVSVLAFRDEGILPEALVNFMALIGWHTGDDREFFSREELIREFSLERVQKKGGGL